MDYNKLSNSELKLKLIDFENEYEALKSKIRDNVARLDELDKLYNEVKDLLNKRTKGR
jgi:hypothetical protein